MPAYRQPSQRTLALEHANRLRIRRAKFKRSLKKAGREDAMLMVARQLVEPEDWIEGMQIHELLMALPLVGPQKVGRMMNVAGIYAADKRVGDNTFTFRQRVALCAVLGHPRAEEARHGKLIGATLRFQGADVLT